VDPIDAVLSFSLRNAFSSLTARGATLRQVNQLFQIEGIPKSFAYDRSGKLVAQSIDMRTQKQFLEMLARAGLR
jgi:hypothetical protein